MKYLVVLLLVALGTTSAFAADGTVVHLGPILTYAVKWVIAAFGTVASAAVVALTYKVFGYLGIQTTQVQRDQLQGIIVNGLNDAAAKAEATIAANPRLDIDVKQLVIADAITYAQKHGKDTIKALGLDPLSGEAIAVIKARIATAVTDINAPTPAVLGGNNQTQPLAPK